jgi:hypothetical protein
MKKHSTSMGKFGKNHHAGLSRPFRATSKPKASKHARCRLDTNHGYVVDQRAKKLGLSFREYLSKYPRGYDGTN